jgi:nicotinamidase/pyrazinamidase
LLVVDVQNDFCPGGALPVAGGDEIVPVLNNLIDRFDERGALIVLSRDWHPVLTNHFSSSGGIWPDHCVQGTRGAEFHPELRIPADAVIVSKGMARDEDGYSAFVARDDLDRRLADLLREEGTQRLLIAGLATDYCVLHSVLDALAAGFTVDVVEGAIRAVDVQPGDGDRAISRMKAVGARFISA